VDQEFKLIEEKFIGHMEGLIENINNNSLKIIEEEL